MRFSEHFKNSYRDVHCVKSCPYSEFFLSAFSRIWTEYGEIRSISPYSVQCGKIPTRKTPNTDTFHAVPFRILSNTNGVFSWKKRLKINDYFHKKVPDVWHSPKYSYELHEEQLSEPITRRWYVKKGVLKNFANSLGSTCAKASLLIKFQASGSGVGVFLWILRDF